MPNISEWLKKHERDFQYTNQELFKHRERSLLWKELLVIVLIVGLLTNLIITLGIDLTFAPIREAFLESDFFAFIQWGRIISLIISIAFIFFAIWGFMYFKNKPPLDPMPTVPIPIALDDLHYSLKETEFNRITKYFQTTDFNSSSVNFTDFSKNLFTEIETWLPKIPYTKVEKDWKSRQLKGPIQIPSHLKSSTPPQIANNFLGIEASWDISDFAELFFEAGYGKRPNVNVELFIRIRPITISFNEFGMTVPNFVVFFFLIIKTPNRPFAQIFLDVFERRFLRNLITTTSASIKRLVP